MPSQQAGPCSAGGVRVLLVDDNRDAVDMLAEVLIELGHAVLVAYDAESALDEVAAFRPELALLDIGLPVMDGYELARQLRAMPDIQPRLIALSGFGSERDRELARAAGFDAHVLKPIDIETLHMVIDTVLTSSAP